MPKRDHDRDKMMRALGVAGFIVMFLTLLIGIIVVSDEQAAAVLFLSKTDLNNAGLLLSRLGFLFRVAIIPTFIALALIIYLPFKHQMESGQDELCQRVCLVPHEKAIEDVIRRLRETIGVSSMCIWGYSLNWAAAISSFLAEYPCPEMAVRIFVPSENIIGTKFSDDHSEERKKILGMRLSEWRQLADRKMVKSLQVFRHDLIPNDLGLIVDAQYGFMGTYVWEASSASLQHRRAPRTQRLRFMLTNDCNVHDFFLRHDVMRFLCREHDARSKS